MSQNLRKQINSPSGEAIVIPDECGDSMWDAVLSQEVKAFEVKEISKNASMLSDRINTHKSVNLPQEDRNSNEEK